MEKYLYLTRKEWALTWLNGGVIPILPASTYLSNERNGTSTPDENRIHDSPVDITTLPGVDFGGASIKSLTYTGNTFNGVKAPDVVNAKYYLEDGIILSFCNRKSKSIAKRLGKTAAVKIFDIEELKTIIDKQLGVKGVIGNCEYTTDHKRNHFLKSTEDQWQDEYRIFWPITEPKQITLPKGIAASIKLKI
ncbi:hypothetical protein [Pseudoalteromonas undina]|uniref:hypothetical protein n=1 Tax=Pseudoalteromonas undina TaxID=43660 RepID=UPI001867973B|nr:hypothetical protein [Pseudoalteromonas undina]